MQPIIYDVAVSADGYISGAGGDVSGFPHHGAIVDAYRARLATYGTVLMGRATYEFGLAYGLSPGANPYPGMRAFVVSTGMEPPDDADFEMLPDLDAVASIRAAADRPVYLCGGGILAGAMLARGLIDEIVLKRAPILLGAGVPLFAGDAPAPAMSLAEHLDHGEGIVQQRYVRA